MAGLRPSGFEPRVRLCFVFTVLAPRVGMLSAARWLFYSLKSIQRLSPILFALRVEGSLIIVLCLDCTCENLEEPPGPNEMLAASSALDGTLARVGMSGSGVAIIINNILLI